MRIVIDANIPLGREFFSTVGEVVAVPPREIGHEHLVNADALVVRSVKKITAAMLTNTSIKFVGTCTAGFDHLDTKAIAALNIHWCNAPGSNANSVVEYVISALSGLNVPWLRAQNIGIVGRGQVGGLLHKRLRALGVSCHCYDPFLSPQDNPDLGEFDRLFDCDIVCLHAPYTTDGKFPSHHLLNADNLPRLKANAVLINAGRGGVVDNAALLALLTTRSDLHCVLDVWENEPNISEALVKQVDLATPHIAGHSIDGKMKGTAMIYSSFCRYFKVKEVVTLAQLDQPAELADIAISSDSVEEAVQQATLSAYDARSDSQEWREMIDNSGNVAVSFDRYRKNYPQRREFDHYKVNYSGSNPKVKQALEIFGFQIA